MHLYACIALFLSASVCGRLFEEEAYLSEYADSPVIASTGTTSSPTCDPLMTAAPTIFKRIELRQAPEFASVDNPSPLDALLVEETDSLDAGPPNSLNPILENQADPTAPTLITASPATSDWVTTQWVETWIGGTFQTWLPHTITIHFEPHMTQAPLPGKGEIGMGTITRKPGKTETVVMMAGAPTQEVGWLRGIGVAIGVGVEIVGMVV